MRLVSQFISRSCCLLSTRNLRLVLLIASLLLLVTVPACKKSGKVGVHGHVSYKGKPLEHATLNFYPERGRMETAEVKDGEYSTDLTPGEYAVVVLIGANVPQGYKEGDPLPKPAFVLPDQYTSRAKSTLKCTVAEGKKEPIDFDLK